MFDQTCGDCRLLFFCRRATGAASARPSLRPRFIQEGGDVLHTPGETGRGNEGARAMGDEWVSRLLQPADGATTRCLRPALLASCATAFHFDGCGREC